MNKESIEVKKSEDKKEINAEEKYFINGADYNSNAFNTDYINKTHYLCWSGGCDSTVALFDMIHQGIKDICVVYSIPNWESDGQVSGEKKARKQILEFIKNKYPDVIINKIQIELNITYSKQNYGPYGLIQQQSWLLQALPFMEDNSVLHLGFIKGDDFWEYKHLFEQIFNADCKMMTLDNVELAYDTHYYQKYQIIWKLCTEGVINLVHYCERHDEDPCGECHSCQEFRRGMKLYLYEMDRYNEIQNNKNIKENK